MYLQLKRYSQNSHRKEGLISFAIAPMHHLLKVQRVNGIIVTFTIHKWDRNHFKFADRAEYTCYTKFSTQSVAALCNLNVLVERSSGPMLYSRD